MTERAHSDEATPDQMVEPLIELTPLATTIQDVFVRSYGSDCDPLVDLRSDSAETAVAASVEKLRGDGKSGQRYQLKGEIGRGGMGAVLRIFDADLRRHLAMKVVLGRGGQTGGSAATIEPSRVLRFLEEAQVTGQLDHPGVVPVHELGVDAAGRVYFTMRLVKGEDLAQVFERVHAGEPDWSFTRALGVLLKVCEAMSYAHEKGVVHRDLKPQNIMVGQHGAVYVMDWGLARVEGRADTHDVRPQAGPEAPASVRTDRRDSAEEDLDSPLLTMDGAVMGSPCYMPPEQAAGRLAEIGPHSDVYALGAMLYTLLTGRLPYLTPGVLASQRTILARVLAGPPTPVQEAAPSVPPELVAICEKAMARNLRERYANMGELAEDLRAYLENRVVHAHRTGAVVELQKWIQRNKALAATLLAFVVVSVGGSTTAAIVLGAKNEVIRIARDDAVEERIRADAARLASERVTDFLASRFRTLEPEATRGRPVQVREFLDDAARSLEGELAGSPLEAAKLRKVLGEAYSSLGFFDQAEPLLYAAHRDRHELLGGDHPDTLTSLSDVASTYMSQGRYSEAETRYKQVLDRRRVVQGEDHPKTFSAMNNLAALYNDQARFEEAEELFVAALDKSRIVLGEQDPSTLRSMSNLASIYMSRGRYADAEPLFVAALASRRADLGDDHPDTLVTINNLGLLFELQARFEEAEVLQTEAWVGRRAVLSEDHPQTLTSQNNLASLYKSMGRYSEAEPLLTRALERSRSALGEDHPRTLRTQNNLASLYNAMGRAEEAGPLYEKTLARLRAVFGEDHPSTLDAMINLAGYYEGRGRLAEAEALLTRALEKDRVVHGEDHPNTVTAIGNLAFIYESQGRSVESEKLYLQALEKGRVVFGEGHPKVLNTLNNLATLYRRQERDEESESLYKEALAAGLIVLGEDNPSVLITKNGLGTLYLLQGRFEEAEPLYVETLARRRAVLGEDHPSTLTSMENLSLLYRRQGRYAESEQLLTQTLELHRLGLGEDHAETLRTLDELRQLYEEWLPAQRDERGLGHPETLTTQRKLAVMLASLADRSQEAEELLLDCLDRRIESLGENHADTLESLHDLASYCEQVGRSDEAEALFLECLQKRRSVLGEEHTATLTTLEELTRLYADASRWNEAAPRARRLLELTPSDADEYEARSRLLARIVAEAGQD